MTNVHHVDPTPLSRVFPARQARTQAPVEREAPPATEPARADKVDLSDDARAFRADLVARVRNEIASGTYVTPDKLDAAIDAIASDIAD